MTAVASGAIQDKRN